MLKLKLHIFPLLEVIFFILALLWFSKNLYISVAFIVMAALFLNFSLHITVHHLVHFKFKSKFVNVLFEFLYSILLVLPFSFYKLQHINHHRYNNSIKDITSTYKLKNNQLVSKSWFRYCFLWFIVTPSKHFWEEAKEVHTNEMFKLKIQALSIVLVYVILAIINPWFVLYYVFVFYFGWMFIALTNYGQHLPIQKNNPNTFSFYNPIYNFIFFNSGLHHEHHINANKNYNELQPKNTNKLKLPHLLAGFFNIKHYTK